MKTKEEIIEEFESKFDKNKVFFKKSSGEIIQDTELLNDIVDFWIEKLTQQKKEIMKEIMEEGDRDRFE